MIVPAINHHHHASNHVILSSASVVMVHTLFLRFMAESQVRLCLENSAVTGFIDGCHKCPIAWETKNPRRSRPYSSVLALALGLPLFRQYQSQRRLHKVDCPYPAGNDLSQRFNGVCLDLDDQIVDAVRNVCLFYGLDFPELFEHCFF